MFSVQLFPQLYETSRTNLNPNQLELWRGVEQFDMFETSEVNIALNADREERADHIWSGSVLA
jgi:hypothetical protein